jgi:hypothetical protein
VAVGRRQAHPHETRRRLLDAGRFSLRLDQLTQGLAALQVVALAGIGQAHLPRRAHQQAHAQPRFQTRHRSADGCRGEARDLRRGREAAVLRRQAEQLDAAQAQVVELTGHC